MSNIEKFPSAEDWDDLQKEWDNPRVLPETKSRPDFSKPIEPDWDSLLDD